MTRFYDFDRNMTVASSRLTDDTRGKSTTPYFEHEKRCMSKKIVIAVMVTMSATGISIANVGSTSITPFYLAFILPLALWVVSLAKGESKLDGPVAFMLCWGVIFVLFSMINPASSFAGENKNSLLHFCFYVAVGACLFGVLRNHSSDLKIVCCSVIILYFAVTAAQLLFHVLSVPVPDLLSQFFDPYFDLTTGQLRYAGLSSEPSYLAMIVTMSAIALVRINKVDPCKHLWVLLALSVLTLLISQTMLGIMSVAVILVAVFSDIRSRSNSKVYSALTIVFILIVVIMALDQIASNYYFNRLTELVSAVSTSGRQFLTQLQNSDSSVWFRIAPFVLLVGSLDFMSIYAWFGNGIGTSTKFYTNLIWGSNAGSEAIRTPFYSSSMYDIGIVGMLSFLIYILRFCWSSGFICCFYLCICYWNCAFSTQAFWFLTLIAFWTSSFCRSVEFTKKRRTT